MVARWILRKSHYRRLTSGNFISVRESWAYYKTNNERKRQQYRHACPKCGARILSSHMPNGGWVHYEGAKGLFRVKHPCLHQGEGLSRIRDELTPDLFDH